MKYDFTSIIDRRGKDAIAVEMTGFGKHLKDESPIKEGFDFIPMWVADMNFATCPTVCEELHKRVDHPLFGYFEPTDEYYDSIIAWHKNRNGMEVPREAIGYENSVLGGVATALETLCSAGDKILIHSPTYVGFTGTLTNHGYYMIKSELKKDEQGIYRMDFDDMEKKIAENNIHVCVFCSPHNPCGRMWTREELEQAYAIFKKYDVTVICDEIWSDIIGVGNTYIPPQSISEDAKLRTISQYAITKTFNMGGMIGSYHIIYDKRLRDRINKQGSLSHYNNMNVLIMHATIGAYKPEGYQWTDELCQVITENIEYSVNYIEQHFTGVEATRPEATYMLFIDCEKWCKAHDMTIQELLHKGMEYGVIWQDGTAFGGEYTIRINLALPLSRVKEAFDRLDKYVFNA